MDFIFLPPANEVWGKVIFLRVPVCHSVHGGEYLGRYPPTRYPPSPWDQVHPPRAGTSPQDQVHPPDQVHHLGPGTPPCPGPGTPYQTRYPPPDQVHPPRPGTTPRPGTPPDQVHPPAGTPPREQSMLGETGNKWAARILLECILVSLCICSSSLIYWGGYIHTYKYTGS